MKILVVGATGKTGELAWRKAVAEGHDVTVFGRSVAKRYRDDPVRKMQGDVLDRSAVTAAIAFASSAAYGTTFLRLRLLPL